MMGANPRVLLISPSFPFPPAWGFGARAYNLARQVALRHPLTLLCYGPSDGAGGIGDLRELGADVRVVPNEEPVGLARRAGQLRSVLSTTPFHWRELQTAAMQSTLDDIVSRQQPDIVQLESSRLCNLLVRGADHDGGGPAVIIDEHNIEYELLGRMSEVERNAGRRLFNRIEQAKVRRLEVACWQEAEGCAVTSDREEAIVRRSAPATRTAVVPNAVDPSYFFPVRTASDDDTIVFSGLLSYRPNLDAARLLIGEILPAVQRLRPGARLTIVGYEEPPVLRDLRGPGVTVTGWVPDIRPHIARASVVVAPLRVGSGTRLKIIEALAMGKAVISTSVGCEGLAVRDGEHLLIADDLEEFCSAVAEALADADLRSSLGAAGRALAVERYSWDEAGERLEDLYQRVAGRPGRAVRSGQAPQAPPVGTGG